MEGSLVELALVPVALLHAVWLKAWTRRGRCRRYARLLRQAGFHRRRLLLTVKLIAQDVFKS